MNKEETMSDKKIKEEIFENVTVLLNEAKRQHSAGLLSDEEYASARKTLEEIETGLINAEEKYDRKRREIA